MAFATQDGRDTWVDQFDPQRSLAAVELPFERRPVDLAHAAILPHAPAARNPAGYGM